MGLLKKTLKDVGDLAGNNKSNIISNRLLERACKETDVVYKELESSLSGLAQMGHVQIKVFFVNSFQTKQRR